MAFHETLSIPFFVINLPRSVDRRHLMEERLRDVGLTPTFFDAVDGTGLDVTAHPAYDGSHRRLFFGKDLMGTEIGCLLSHHDIYQYIVENRVSHAVIFEDDAVMAPDFPDVVQALLACSRSWDIVRFLASKKVYKNSRTVGPLTRKHRLIRFKGTPGCAYAYMINRKAAQTLLEHTKKNFLPIDILLGHAWRMGLQTFAVRPSPAWNDENLGSTIGATRFDKTVRLHGGQRLAYPFTRFAWKLYDMFGKRWAYWSSLPYDWRLGRRLRQR